LQCKEVKCTAAVHATKQLLPARSRWPVLPPVCSGRSGSSHVKELRLVGCASRSWSQDQAVCASSPCARSPAASCGPSNHAVHCCCPHCWGVDRRGGASGVLIVTHTLPQLTRVLSGSTPRTAHPLIHSCPQVLGAAYPWVSRRLLTQGSPELHATLNNLLYDKSGQFQFDRLESLLEQAAKAAVSARSSVAATTAPPAATAAVTTAGRAATPGPVAAAAAAGPGGLFGSVWGPASAVAGPAGELLGSFIPAFSSQQQQQRVGGRGSQAAAAGGPLALVLSPEGRYIRWGVGWWCCAWLLAVMCGLTVPWGSLVLYACLCCLQWICRNWHCLVAVAGSCPPRSVVYKNGSCQGR
jgi:hypothetical protein